MCRALRAQKRGLWIEGSISPNSSVQRLSLRLKAFLAPVSQTLNLCKNLFGESNLCRFGKVQWEHRTAATGAGDPTEPCLPLFRAPFPHPCRNSSTMDLTLFAAEAIALNRQLSQHEENEQNKLAQESEVLSEGLCSVKLSPPSKSRLARRRALAQAGRSGDAPPSPTPTMPAP